MNALVLKPLASLAGCVVRLNVTPEKTPVPLSEEDVGFWRAATADQDAWVEPRSLRRLLRLLRDPATKEWLYNEVWTKDPTTDLLALDRSLTDAALEVAVRPAWLWLRLRIFRADQQDSRQQALTVLAKLRPDFEKLVALRDAVLVAHCIVERGQSAHPAASVADDDADLAFREAFGLLEETLGDERCDLLRHDAAVRQALGQIGVDATACLALDVVTEYAARRLEKGDPQTATLARLIADVLATGRPLEGMFPGVDWEDLKKKIAEGDTTDLAELANGRRLVHVMLRALCGRAAPEGVPQGWLEMVQTTYWTPFRTEALRGGWLWIVDALSLQAAVRTVVEPEKDPSTFLAAWYEPLLGLQTAADDSGKTRLEQLVLALELLDAEAFHAAVAGEEPQARAIAVDLLLHPPASEEEGQTAQVLGLEGKTLFRRLYESCENQWTGVTFERQSADTLFKLFAIGLQQKEADDGQFLETVCRGLIQIQRSREGPQEERPGRENQDHANQEGQRPDEPEPLAALVEKLVTAFVAVDPSTFYTVTAGDMLLLHMNNREWLKNEVAGQGIYVDGWLSGWRDVLLREQYEDLAAKVPLAPEQQRHSGLRIAWQLVSGEASEAIILKAYQINRPQLDSLRSAFYAGEVDWLARVFTPCGPRPIEEDEGRRVTKTERVVRWLHKATRALNVWLALLALLVLGYLGLHLYVLSWPLEGDTAKVAPVELTDDTDVVIKGLTRYPASSQVKPVYVASSAVTYADYTRLMPLPAGAASRQVGASTQQEVSFATYEEAREYCARWTDYLRAKHPVAFSESGKLCGYVCRLPRPEEASQVPLQLRGGAGPEAEWVHPSGPAQAAALAKGVLAPKPVQSLKTPEKDSVEREPGKEQVTFRTVLAPGESGGP
jgi:hypothetical protein